MLFIYHCALALTPASTIKGESKLQTVSFRLQVYWEIELSLSLFPTF